MSDESAYSAVNRLNVIFRHLLIFMSIIWLFFVVLRQNLVKTFFLIWHLAAIVLSWAHILRFINGSMQITFNEYDLIKRLG
jgi:hypothetical protein